MSNDSARIAGLVGSRICHDLVSPVGAISNGLELIALAGQPGPEEMALISQSCSSATARINLFRMAFGAASADQQIGGAEARKHDRGKSVLLTLTYLRYWIDIYERERKKSPASSLRATPGIPNRYPIAKSRCTNRSRVA